MEHFCSTKAQRQQQQTTVLIRTFVAVPDRVEVDVVAVVTEEHETEPRVKRVDWNDEENAHDPALLVRAAVVAQVHEDLKRQSTSLLTSQPHC